MRDEGIEYPTDPKEALAQWLRIEGEVRAVQASFARAYGMAYAAAIETVERDAAGYRHARQVAQTASIGELSAYWAAEPKALAAAAWAGHVLGDMRLFIKPGVGP